MKLSCIMASYLQPYPGAAQNREKKFIRAVKSFLNQSFKDSELIIIGDGCTRTYEIYEENWANESRIQCFLVPKQPLYGGGVRTEGLKQAKGKIITYLDNDDVLGTYHHETIVNQWKDSDGFVYYDDYLVLSNDFKQLYKRIVEPRWASIGTSAISHKNADILKEDGWLDGYGHDFLYIMKMAAFGLKFRKLEKTPYYLVCHHGQGDF